MPESGWAICAACARKSRSALLSLRAEREAARIEAAKAEAARSAEVDPYWYVWRKAADCPSKTLISSHPKCCEGCPYPQTPCAKALDCGERCFLPEDHIGPCLCIGDEDGVAGTCPA